LQPRSFSFWPRMMPARAIKLAQLVHATPQFLSRSRYS
jgi:hypothetical protein